jgi:hypothetical protein
LIAQLLAAGKTSLNAVKVDQTGPNYPPAAKGYNKLPKWAQEGPAYTPPPSPPRTAAKRQQPQQQQLRSPEPTAAAAVNDFKRQRSDVGERLEDLQDRVAAAPAAVRSRVNRATSGIRTRLGNLQVQYLLHRAQSYVSHLPAYTVPPASRAAITSYTVCNDIGKSN